MLTLHQLQFKILCNAQITFGNLTVSGSITCLVLCDSAQPEHCPTRHQASSAAMAQAGSHLQCTSPSPLFDSVTLSPELKPCMCAVTAL